MSLTVGDIKKIESLIDTKLKPIEQSIAGLETLHSEFAELKDMFTEMYSFLRDESDATRARLDNHETRINSLESVL